MFTQEEIDAAAVVFPVKKSGKQIMGVVKIRRNGEKRITRHFLEDGSEAIEDDTGAAASWPTGKYKKRSRGA